MAQPMPFLTPDDRDLLRQIADRARSRQAVVKHTGNDPYEYAHAVGVESVLLWLAGDSEADESLSRILQA